ncbi:MAG: DUF2238 domain-containing protein [Deltaproteobacteria bacterium]|nr:DUF2238 domain-containing protein [Deltaproteobacteria bacterium]
MSQSPHPSKTEVITWLGGFAVVFIWSAIAPKDLFTWFLEVVPALAALVAMAATWRRFPLSRLVYWWILIHCIVLMVGGHYTYAEVPLFDWIRDWTNGTRNNYDKVGHFAQGFIPALVAREIFIRLKVVRRGAWLFVLVTAFCLAISAFYEFIEWWVAVATGENAEAFLGTQGYAWDTQSDMLLAMIGAMVAQLIFGRWQDKQIKILGSTE